MGLTKNDDPEKIERDLMALIPQKDWTIFSHRMIFHGRQVCQRPQAQMRRMRTGEDLSEDRRRVAV